MEAILQNVTQRIRHFHFNGEAQAILVLGLPSSGKSITSVLLAEGINDHVLKLLFKNPGHSTIVNSYDFMNVEEGKNDDTGVYECPSFGVQQDPATDMVSSYFIHKLTHQLHRIKFLFTVNYSTFSHFDELDDFVNWLRQVRKIMKNIDAFEHNIGLVVNRVDHRQQLSDDVVIRELKHFLETVKLYIEETEYDWKFKNYAIKFIDVLNDENCNKLAIMRRLNELNPDEVLYHLEHAKLAIQRMLKNCVEFVGKAEKNFRYSISEEAQNYVENLFEEIHVSINSILTSLSSIIQENMNKREKECHDTHELKKQLQAAIYEIGIVISQMNHDITIEHLGDRLEDCLGKLDIHTAGHHTSKIFIQDKYFKLLQQVTLNKLKIDHAKFQQPLNNVVEYFKQVLTFYHVINTAYEMLTSYNVQMNMKEKHSDLERRRIEFSKSQTMMPWGFFQDLQNQVQQERIKPDDYDRIKSLDMTESRRETMLEILDSALKNNKSVITVNNGKELIVTGSYLNVEDIKSALNGKIKSIKVFARKKIFIRGLAPKHLDDKFIFQPVFHGRQHLRIIMIAPIWVVLNHRNEKVNCKNTFLGIGKNFTSHEMAMYDPNEWTTRCKLDFINLDGLNPETCGVRVKFNADPIVEYKKFLLGLNLNRVDYHETTQMLQMLSENSCIRSTYDIATIVDDFLNLELHFDWKRKTEFIPLYESLVETIKVTGSQATDPDLKKQLTTVYTAAWSKCWSLKKDLSGNLIINIQEKLDNFEKQLTDLQNEENIRAMIESSEQYQDKVGTEINGMLNIINTRVMPELKSINQAIKDRMTVFKKEIDDLRTRYLAASEAKEELRDKMQASFAGSLFMKIVQTSVQIAGVFSGTGAVFSASLDPVFDAGQAMFESGSSPSSSSNPLAKGVTMGLQDAIAGCSDYLQEDDAFDDSAIQVVREMATEASKAGAGEFIESILDATSQYLSIGKNKDQKGVGQVETSKQKNEKMKEVRQKTSEAVKKSKSGSSKAQKLAKGMQAASIGVQGVIDIWRSSQDHAEALRELDEAKEEDLKKSNELAQYGNYLKDQLIPNIENSTKLLESSTAMDIDSRAMFNEQKWRVQQTIRGMQNKARTVLAGFDAQEDVMSYYKQLRDVMDIVSNIYDQIHDAQERKGIVHAMSQMNEASMGAQRWDDDNPLTKKLKEIQHKIRYNAAFGQFSRLVEGLAVTVFPFAKYYMGEDKLMGETMNKTNTIHEMIQKITTYKGQLTTIKSFIENKIDNSLYEASFSSRRRDNNPFYVWKNEDYNRDIGKLLSGEEIVLVADVANGRPENAVKFSTIEFILTTVDEKMQEEIDRILLEFEVSLIHSGVSRYKCGLKYYVIVGGGIQLDYTYAKHDRDNKDPLDMSVAYRKIRESIPILSPYTTWRVKLTKKNDDSDTGFEELAQYQDYVDLELTGDGTFIKQGAKICDEELETFYKVDLSLPKEIGYREEFNDFKAQRTRRSVITESIGTSQQNASPFDFSLVFNGTLLLLNVLVQKCKSSKPVSNNEVNHEKFLEDAFIRSRNLIMKSEPLIDDLFQKHDMMENRIFEPCVVAKEVTINIVNGGRKKNGDIIYDYVKRSNRHFINREFLEELRSITSIID